MAQYDKAPIKEVSFLIFQDDIPKRKLHKDEVKKAKYIEPILKQLDNNIMDDNNSSLFIFYFVKRGGVAQIY